MSDLNSIDKLMEIANFLNAKNLEAELSTIKERSMQPQAELVFPLIGEFSAGKTTLINALTDCKKLETATLPTTATIYEIHFGCDRCHATVLNEQGELEEVEDIASLKNERLANATVVNIFDTSTRIPSTTILVDTPGLSSPNPKHKQTLVNFLPNADGILLVTDVNQQITRSLTDFIEMMKLSKRPIYMVITKCDTKSKPELEEVKKYISVNCKLPIQQMACVSAAKNDMDELYALLDSIQKDKNAILAQVNEQKLKKIGVELSKIIDELLESSSSDKELDEAIKQQESGLYRLNHTIDKLILNARDDIQNAGRETTRQFEEIIPGKLETLVTSKCDNFDSRAISLINNTAALLFNNYKSQIKKILYNQARNNDKEGELSLNSLPSINLSTLSIAGLNYDLDLNSLGHQYDRAITYATYGLGIVAAATTVVSRVGTAVVGKVLRSGFVAGASIADTVSDVASMHSNRKIAREIDESNKRTAMQIENAISAKNDGMEPIEGDFVKNSQALGNNYNNLGATYGQFTNGSNPANVNANKGIVESMVGFITDKTMGKPQRRRAIRVYMDETLLPEFKIEMERNGDQVIDMISDALHREADEVISQKKEGLSQLKKEYNVKKEAFEQRKSKLREYKTILVTL